MVVAGVVEDLGPMVEMVARVPAKQANPQLINPMGLAAARLLGPAARKLLSGCRDAVRSVTGKDGRTLTPEFGALCDAAIRGALGLLDAAAGGHFRKSPIARRIQANLQENLYSEMVEAQVAIFREATFASFRGKLNKLSIGPGVFFYLVLLAACTTG